VLPRLASSRDGDLFTSHVISLVVDSRGVRPCNVAAQARRAADELSAWSRLLYRPERTAHILSNSVNLRAGPT